MLGNAGPMVAAAMLDTQEGITAWRVCVLCGWRSEELAVSEDDPAASSAAAGSRLCALQFEHLEKFHPDFIEQTLKEADALAPPESLHN